MTQKTFKSRKYFTFYNVGGAVYLSNKIKMSGFKPGNKTRKK